MHKFTLALSFALTLLSGHYSSAQEVDRGICIKDGAYVEFSCIDYNRSCPDGQTCRLPENTGRGFCADPGVPNGPLCGPGLAGCPGGQTCLDRQGNPMK